MINVGPNTDYHFMYFDALPARILYEIMSLRYKVFTEEQGIVCNDFDYIDLSAVHVTASQNGELAGYCRIIPKGYNNQTTSIISRVVVAKEYRKQGIGSQLIKLTEEYIHGKFGKGISLKGQYYLSKYYTNLGFTATSEPYIFEEIMHQNFEKQ